MLSAFRPCLPVALALLCCACSTPEERADAAFAELVGQVQQLRQQLAGIGTEQALLLAIPELEERAEELRDTLERIDELALHPDMTPEAHQRVGEAHHAALSQAVETVLAELARIGRRGLGQPEELKRLLRREYAHYSTRGVHPWSHAVLRGRKFRPPKPRGN